MPRLALASQSYERASLGLPPEEAINVYVEETPQVSDEAFAIISTPGLDPLLTVGAGPITSIFQEEGFLNGSIFLVSGGDFYRLDFGTACDLTTLTATLIGNVGAGGGASFLESYASDEIAIVNDGRYFVFDGAATITEVLAAARPFDPVNSLASLDQRTVYGSGDTSGQYAWSEVLDPGNTPVLNFATAERKTDRLAGLIEYGDEIWLFGPKGIEVVYGTGDATVPFERRDGVTIDFGCPDFGTVKKIDNGLVFRDIQNRIFQINGYSPSRISTHGIEDLLTDPDCALESWSWSYGKTGHEFYGLTIPGVLTMVYDVATQRWHRRQTPGQDDYRVRVFATVCCRVIAGDHYSGNLYLVDDNLATDNGADIDRTFTTNLETYDRQPFALVALDIVQSGPPSAAAPQVGLEYSDDRGVTFKPIKLRGLGAQNEALRVSWRRLGTSRRHGRVFRFTASGVVIAVSNAEVSEQER
jgi:hypothetical protein